MSTEKRTRPDFATIQKSKDWDQFIDAFNKLKQSPDYLEIARYHGIDYEYCHDDENDFLGWHRCYVLRFENLLRKASGNKNVTLPYLDWASDEYVNVLKTKLEDSLNKTPLDSYSIGKIPNPREDVSQIENTTTTRSTNRRPIGKPGYDIRKNVDSAINLVSGSTVSPQGNPNFSDILNGGAHGIFHVWVGGYMGQVPIAAYDPVFWMHHCNVDRLWTIWQNHNGKSIQQKEINDGAPYLQRDFSKKGFKGIKFGDVMNNSKLPSLLDDGNYVSVTYEDQDHPYKLANTNLRSLNTAFIVTGGEVNDHQVVLALDNLTPTNDSFSIHANFDLGNNESFEHTFAIFGHGSCCNEDNCKNIVKDIKDTVSRCVLLSSSEWEKLKKHENIGVKLEITNVTREKDVPLKNFQEIMKNTLESIPELAFNFHVSDLKGGELKKDKVPKIKILY